MKRVIRIIRNCQRCNSIFLTRQKLLNIGKGKYCSISCARKDHNPTWLHQNYKGRGRKIGDSIIKGNWREERSPAWKGEKVGYRALHLWVEKHLGKANHCSYNSEHRSARYHWANISRKYLRDLSDWIQLCPSCHLNADRKGLVISY